MDTTTIETFGWLKDPPDIRDFHLDIPAKEGPVMLTADTAVKPDATVDHLKGRLKKIDFSFALPKKQLSNVQWCSPVQNQLSIGSCTAQAGTGILEYYERRAHGKHIDASPRFLYKVTRKLLGWTGDTGAYCRTTMGAMALFGVPPEKYCTYGVAEFDDSLEPFLYAYAQNYQGLIYHRIDGSNASTMPLLKRVQMMLAIGWPMMFGFSVYESYATASGDGEIPYPAPGERRVGGHAVMAVGYDDNKSIKNKLGGPTTKGAILFKNSWGPNWGASPNGGAARGYGWLPYEYLKTHQAVDWWTLTKAEWIDSGKFGYSA